MKKSSVDSRQYAGAPAKPVPIICFHFATAYIGGIDSA